RRSVLVLAFALAVASVPGAFAFAAPAGDPRDVALVDQMGATFTLRDLRRPAAIAFVATRCSDACPVTTAVFARLAARLAAERVAATLVSITLEPREDTPI